MYYWIWLANILLRFLHVSLLEISDSVLFLWHTCLVWVCLVKWLWKHSFWFLKSLRMIDSTSLNVWKNSQVKTSGPGHLFFWVFYYLFSLLTCNQSVKIFISFISFWSCCMAFQDLSFPIRGWNVYPCSGNRVLTTRNQGILKTFYFFMIHFQ